MQIAIGYPREYSLERFKVMLCDCTCVLPESLRGHNLTPARLKGINLGHDPRRSKYLVYIPAVRRIISTADVIFDEFSFTTLGHHFSLPSIVAVLYHSYSSFVSPC